MDLKVLRPVMLSVLFSLAIMVNAGADTLYLKNGRSLTGVIKSDDGNDVELDLGYGSVKFEKSQIERIYKAKPDEINEIKQAQKRKKNADEEKWARSESEPRKVVISKELGQIGVAALINKKVNAALILDTGASCMVLSSGIVKELGIDIQKEGQDMDLTVADGRQIKAKYINLESVSVEGAVAKDVGAAVILDEKEDLGFKDGLLGLTFLNRFSFKIDNKEKRLILEKLE